VRARICVIIVAKTRCHVVRKIGNPFVRNDFKQDNTETSSVENPFIEQDHRATEKDPNSTKVNFVASKKGVRRRTIYRMQDGSLTFAQGVKQESRTSVRL
jgi:hypothetical protein